MDEGYPTWVRPGTRQQHKTGQSRQASETVTLHVAATLATGNVCSIPNLWSPPGFQRPQRSRILAQELAPGRRRFFSLDDLDVVDAVRRDPETLLGGNQPVTLDEVQREPALLHAVKQAIDRRRQPGRFLLTGSANLLLMRRVSESLAGRASHLTLWPMTRREQRGLGRGALGRTAGCTERGLA